MKQIFTNKEVIYLKKIYPHTRTDIIAKKMNRNIYSIYRKAAAIGVKKSEEFLSSPECGRLYNGHTRGVATQFKKGHISHNKGVKMSSEVREKVKHTFFKKGHKPHNTKYDRCITIRKDTKSGILYFYIRIKEGEWELLHRVIWEKKNGKVPKGFNIVFKDGDQSKVEIDNLEKISDSELLKRNSIRRYPLDLQRLIQIKGALLRQINNLNKIKENE